MAPLDALPGGSIEIMVDDLMSEEQRVLVRSSWPSKSCRRRLADAHFLGAGFPTTRGIHHDYLDNRCLTPEYFHHDCP